MKHLLLATGLLLTGLAPGCSSSPSHPRPTTAQVEALTKDFDTWYRYTYAQVLLARDYLPRDVEGRPLAKQAFLQQLATGRVLALRTGFEHQLPIYQLCAFPGGHDPAIRATSKQLAQEALRNYAWEGQPFPTPRPTRAAKSSSSAGTPAASRASTSLPPLTPWSRTTANSRRCWS
jgi:hypothetical protein